MSKRILIVDDEADINIVLREILESNGFTVDSFDNDIQVDLINLLCSAICFWRYP